MTRRYRHHRRIPSYVWGWLTVAALAVALFFLPSCKVQQHATHQSDAHTESKHLMVYDTTHVTLVTSIRDTNHSAMKHHATEKITEQYDAETGKLTQRITERERDVTLLQTQFRALQERFDSLAAVRVDTLAETTDLHEEDESHKESESKTPWTGIVIVLGIFLFCAIVVSRLIKR